MGADENIRVIADIGRLLPELFAVFDVNTLGAVYINPAGLRHLDPAGTAGLDKFPLASLVGMEDTDRFQREIFPHARVHGEWKGVMALRDITGAEFRSEVRLLDVPAKGKRGGHHLYLHGSFSVPDDADAGLIVTDQDMLHALLEMVPDQIYFKDLQSRFLRVSRSEALKHRRGDPREFIGKTDFDFYGAGHAATMYQEEQLMLKDGRATVDVEQKEDHADGSITWSQATKLPFRNREGKLIGTFGISHDITSRKRAEESIRQSEAMLRGTFTAAPVGIALVHDRTFRKVNDLLCEICGYSAQEILGLSSNAILYFDQAECERVDRELYGDLKQRGRASVEATWRRKDGRRIEVLLKAASLDTDDSLSWKIVSVLDMTEHKTAENALREKEAHLSEAQRIAHIGSWQYDRVENVLLCSDETRRIFGWPLGEAVTPDAFVRLIHPEDLAAFNEQRDAALEGRAAIDLEFRAARPDGQTRHIHVRGIGRADAGGHCTKFEGTVHDITERKQAEAERRDMEARLQLSSKLESVGQLAAGVAHEINTPTQFIADNIRFLHTSFTQLGAILSTHQSLIEEVTPHAAFSATVGKVVAAHSENELEYLQAEIPRCIEQSLEGLKRISKIVGSLKEFSHPNSTEKSLSDLNRAIETAVAVSRHEWKYVADVVTELDPDLPGVHCVLDEINQAVLNLVINAAHAVEDGNKQRGIAKGKITLRTRREGDNVLIEVEDTGTGIPPHVREHMFEPFFTTKGIGKGTGQGLTLVHTVVAKKHNGHVDFVTEVGKGTTFRIRLPIAPAPVPAVSTPA